MDITSIPREHGLDLDKWVYFLKEQGILFYDSTLGNIPTFQKEDITVKMYDVSEEESMAELEKILADDTYDPDLPTIMPVTETLEDNPLLGDLPMNETPPVTNQESFIAGVDPISENALISNGGFVVDENWILSANPTDGVPNPTEVGFSITTVSSQDYGRGFDEDISNMTGPPNIVTDNFELIDDTDE